MPALGNRLGWLLCGLASCTSAASSTAPRATEPAAPIATRESTSPSEPRTPQACQDLLLEDWEDGDVRATPSDGPNGTWRTYKDLNGSTLAPEEPFVPARGGAHGSQYAGHISGKLAAPQAWAGLEERSGDPAVPYDLSRWRRLCFQAKGSGRARLNLPDINTDPAGGVCQRCWNNFGANFALSPEWQEQCFEFEALTQTCCWGKAYPAVTAGKVFALSWSVLTPGADYDLWIDDVQLRCD
jgi:hypothetical protein